MSRAVQTEEYDRRIVAHFQRCLNLASVTAPSDPRPVTHRQITPAVASETT
jgi:hypothetical protein